jgi:hypothetical protein
MAEREVEAFFDIGTQYYVAARYAAFAGLAPVCANLFHHAVEMYMKGYLSSQRGLAELKKLGHRLPDIWVHFKASAADAELDRFDPVISELDRYESIRYPDRVLTEGMRLPVSMGKPHSGQGGLEPTRPEPLCQITVEDMDHLITTIFRKAVTNTRYFTARLNSDATTYLYKANQALPT